MNMNISDMLLGFAVFWPLLLAIPKLHSYLPRVRHLAVLPAAILILMPDNAFLQLPRFLFGSGLSLDDDIRWILGMFIILWFTAASLSKPHNSETSTQETSFFLLTLCGNLGVILSNDLIAFFSFSTLMSYSFYALIVEKRDAPSRHAGQWYLRFLLVADLALFEAMLLAASLSEDLRYDLVRQEMTGDYSSLYMWMVVLGFVLKSGVWPFYFWLTTTFNSCTRTTRVLLGGVPVAMGLLGLLRWLPLGEGDYYTAGIFIFILGAMAISHSILRIFKHGFNVMLSAWFSIAATGLFCITLGSVLIEPALWQTYENLSFPFIALLGTILASLSLIKEKVPHSHQPANAITLFSQTKFKLYGNKLTTIRRQTASILQDFQSKLNAVYLSIIDQCQSYSTDHKLVLLLTGWKVKITLFVILGLAFAWLAK